MTTNYPEKQLESIRRFRWIATVAPIAFLIAAVGTAIVESLARLELTPVPLWVWYLVWAILQTATLAPVVLLLVSAELRKLHTAVRLNIIFAYLLRAWLVYCVFRLRFAFSEGIAWPGVVVRMSILGLVLGVMYWVLRKRYTDRPETMFP